MTLRFAPSILRAGTLAALFAVAACASDKPEPAAATPAPAAAPAQAATDPAATPVANAIGLKACPKASDGRIHFKIADATLAVPSPIISDAVPAGLKPPITEEQVAAELTAQTGKGYGCPGKPLDTGFLFLKGKLDHPLLDGSIRLLSLPPGGITTRFATLTRRLQENPGKNCQPLEGVDDLIGCRGTERRGGGQDTQVLYVITTNKAEKMASGGPLAARCVLGDKAIKGCNLVDLLPGGMVIDVGLNSGQYTTAGLRAALNAATAAVDSMRL